MTRVRKICYQLPCLLLAFLWMSCHGRAQIATEKELNMKEQAELYLAGGCFWGTEHFLKQINGVPSTLLTPLLALPCPQNQVQASALT